jgi:hypothetical protein
MERVSGYGIKLESDPSKLCSSGVVWWRVGFVQECKRRFRSSKTWNWRALDSITEVLLWMVKVGKLWSPQRLPIGNVKKCVIMLPFFLSVGLFLSEEIIPTIQSRGIGGSLLTQCLDSWYRVSLHIFLGIERKETRVNRVAMQVNTPRV